MLNRLSFLSGPRPVIDAGTGPVRDAGARPLVSQAPGLRLALDRDVLRAHRLDHATALNAARANAYALHLTPHHRANALDVGAKLPQRVAGGPQTNATLFLGKSSTSDGTTALCSFLADLTNPCHSILQPGFARFNLGCGRVSEPPPAGKPEKPEVGPIAQFPRPEIPPGGPSTPAGGPFGPPADSLLGPKTGPLGSEQLVQSILSVVTVVIA